MATNLHVRGLPDWTHGTLVRRAASRGMSLRQYVIEVLTAHCALPTVDEWVDQLKTLAPAPNDVSGADAVRHARDEDDAEVIRAHHSG